MAAAEHVGQPAAGDDQHPEHQGVAGDDPLHRGDVGRKILLDRRQGHGERGKIVADDEGRHGHGAHAEQLRLAQLLRVRQSRLLSITGGSLPAGRKDFHSLGNQSHVAALHRTRNTRHLGERKGADAPP